MFMDAGFGILTKRMEVCTMKNEKLTETDSRLPLVERKMKYESQNCDWCLDADTLDILFIIDLDFRVSN